MKNRSGFSVLEIIVCLAIVVIAVLGSTTSKSALAQMKVKFEAKKFQSQSQLALQAAISSEAPVSMTMYRTKYYLDGSGITPQRISLAHGVFLNVNDSHPLSLTYYPSGTASPTTVSVTGDGYQCLLTISLRGRVTSQCS